MSTATPHVKLVGPDDVILVPEDATGGRRALAWFTLVLFLGVCVGTLAIDLAWPAPRQVAIGAEFERERQLEANARFSDGTLAAHTEREMRMTSRVRREVASPYALWLYQKLGYTHGEILAGKHGWLFMHGRTAAGSRTAALRLQLDLALSHLAALARRLEDAGTRLMVMPIPRKEVVASEFLPGGIDVKPWVESRTVEGLRERGVEVVDLSAAWAGRPAAELYHLAGSHWTSEAEWLAARALARALDREVDPAQRSTQLNVQPVSPPEWDLLTMAGVDVHVARAAVDTGGLPFHQVLDRSSGRPAMLDNPQATAQIAVVGTSFTAERGFTRLLSHVVDEQVAKSSELGGEPSKSLVSLLAARAGVPPPIVVFELPIHMLFAGTPLPGIDALTAQLPPPPRVELAPLRLPPGPKEALTQLGQARVFAASWPAELLAHDGWGDVLLRLRRTSSEHEVHIHLRIESHWRVYTWRAGESELWLPIVGANTLDAPELNLFASAPAGRASLELSNAELVARGSQLGEEFPQSVAKQIGGVWRAKLPESAAGGDALFLRIVQPDPKAGPVRVRLVARRGEQVWFAREFRARTGETMAVLDLGPAARTPDFQLAVECDERRIVVKSGFALRHGPQ